MSQLQPEEAGDARSGNAYWDTSKPKSSRTIKLTDATIIFEYDKTHPDPDKRGYDVARVTVDRLSGLMDLSYLTKDGSKEPKIINRGQCHEQRPQF